MRATLAKAVLVGATLMAAIAISQAQNGPAEKGSTGWSGGSKDQPSQSGTYPEVHDEDQARNQPPLATGKDLKGPPIQLPPSKTPE